MNDKIQIGGMDVSYDPWVGDLQIRKAGENKPSIFTELGYGMMAMVDLDTGELVGFWFDAKIIGKVHPDSAEMIARITIPRS